MLKSDVCLFLNYSDRDNFFSLMTLLQKKKRGLGFSKKATSTYTTLIIYLKLLSINQKQSDIDINILRIKKRFFFVAVVKEKDSKLRQITSFDETYISNDLPFKTIGTP